MKIDSVRIYAECLEQGLDFKKYIEETGCPAPVYNIYTKSLPLQFKASDSLTERIRRVKNVDVLITIISEGQECPLLIIEYSSAVPTDDHKMQRCDVYYWSGVLKVPVMKISSASKGMDKKFGGGSKFSDDLEKIISYKKAGAVFYPIRWYSDEKNQMLMTEEDALSCINRSEEIADLLSYLLSRFKALPSQELYFETLRQEYFEKNKDLLSAGDTDILYELFKNSSRFHREGERLRVKINRFGHAMDPERGILYFVNMLAGAENTGAEIQVNRNPDINRRMGYKSLFDSVSNKACLLDYVKQIIRDKGNVFTEEDALHIFLTALNIKDKISFKRVSDKTYIIKDDDLYKFLCSNAGGAAKSIFYLATELRLTDLNREPICTVTWSKGPIEKFLHSAFTKILAPIAITPLTNSRASEDIVTFAGVELCKRAGFKLLAVSYPGAQGDRCILTGNGRSTLRTYVDIIAYKETERGAVVLLQENKRDASRAAYDVQKLKRLTASPEGMKGLSALLEKAAGVSDISKVYTAVGVGTGEHSASAGSGADAAFVFGVRAGSEDDKTIIDCEMSFSSFEFEKEFRGNSGVRLPLKYSFSLDTIYAIKRQRKQIF